MEGNDEWQTIEPGIWKPETEGDQIAGVLVNKEPRDEAAGTSARYYIENQDGMFLVWGSTVIDDRMQYVKIGQKVRVTFEGHAKNKKTQQVNLFKSENIQWKRAQRVFTTLPVDGTLKPLLLTFSAPCQKLKQLMRELFTNTGQPGRKTPSLLNSYLTGSRKTSLKVAARWIKRSSALIRQEKIYA